MACKTARFHKNLRVSIHDRFPGINAKVSASDHLFILLIPAWCFNEWLCMSPWNLGSKPSSDDRGDVLSSWN